METEAFPDDSQAPKIKIGISSCLLGEPVRFDGGHKRDAYINGTLARYFEFVPYCPEVEIGLGIPREPIRLVDRGEDGIHAVGTRTPDRDVTRALTHYSETTTRTLDFISGYILKKDSPSCGMERVKIYSQEGPPLRQGTGLFAAALMRNQPLLPVEEEGRLGDPVLRDNFIERVFVFHRWQTLLAGTVTRAKLVAFHSDHKLLIMAHSQAAYRRLGQIVADLKSRSLEEVANDYGTDLMSTLKRKATRKSHSNVLQHLLGYLKNHLDNQDKVEMLEIIDAYRLGQVPLIVPITLLKHHFRRHPHPYVERQIYLSPHPRELMLRNSL